MAADDCNECPLCMDPLEIDDVSFFPCDCGYQICRFCWTRIINEENGLCPACRTAYNSEKPASFQPISNEEFFKMKKEKKKKDQQKKCKSVVENRKHLSDLRVVQNNLIFIVGIPMRLANEIVILSSNEYLGKYGKVYKLVVNHNNTFSGPQGQQCVSAYVTYRRTEDAMRAVLDLNKREIDGRQLKVSLGTTKYCSQFLRGVQCTKPECMYLHELGNDEASFTKEDMQQGKHTEYEQHLIASYLTGSVQDNLLLEQTASPELLEGSKPRHDSFSASPSQAVLTSREQRKRQTSLNAVINPGGKGDSIPDLSHNGVIQLPSGVQLSPPPTSQDLTGGWSGWERDQYSPDKVDLEDDDDAASYDFDPFRESQEGLAEMMETERCMSAAYQQFLTTNRQQAAPLPHPPPGYEMFLQRLPNLHQHSQPPPTSQFPPTNMLSYSQSAGNTNSVLSDFPNSIRHPDELNMHEFHQALRSLLPHANISFGSSTPTNITNNNHQHPQHLSSPPASINKNQFGGFNDFPPSPSSLSMHIGGNSSNTADRSSSWVMQDPAILVSSKLSQSSLNRTDHHYTNGFTATIPTNDDSHTHQNLWGSLPPGLDLSMLGSPPSQSFSLAGPTQLPIQSTNYLRQRAQSNSFQL